MKKLLIMGKEGRLEKYTDDRTILKKYEIVYVPLDASDNEILEKGRDAECIIVDAVGSVSGYIIDNMPNLKLIHSEGVGYQGIDVKAAAGRSIYVCNCKGMNSTAVAEQTILIMLGLLRDVVGGDGSVRKGTQIITKEAYMLEGSLKELGECTVGLIGFGDIAKATARLLRVFGAKVVYYKPNRLTKGEEGEYKADYMPLDCLLGVSDIVSLHLPVSSETKYMADETFFKKMKNTSYLINTSRGELVNSKALVEAIECGEIAGAGLDTIDGEPVHEDNPLLSISNQNSKKLLLSCHIGGITGASFKRGYNMIWSSIEKVEKGERPDNVVNL